MIVAFFPTGESEIELVEPVNETSGVARYLAKRGPGIHHICVEVDDIAATLGRLKEKGVQLIDEEPTIGSGGKKVAFVHPHSTSGVLIELYQLTPEEPQRRADVIAGLQKRFDVERQVLSAGMSAFLTRLRELTGLSRSGEVVIGSTRGIKLKAAGDIPDKKDGQN